MFQISLPWLYLFLYKACPQYLKCRRDLLYVFDIMPGASWLTLYKRMYERKRGKRGKKRRKIIFFLTVGRKWDGCHKGLGLSANKNVVGFRQINHWAIWPYILQSHLYFPAPNYPTMNVYTLLAVPHSEWGVRCMTVGQHYYVTLVDVWLPTLSLISNKTTIEQSVAISPPPLSLPHHRE